MIDRANVRYDIDGQQGCTHSTMFLPSPLLTPVVRAYLSRSTGAGLTFDERCNHFAATPTCVIVWVIRGHDTRLNEAGHLSMPVIFGGPHTHPSVSHNAGPVHFFTMLVYPDALQAMLGITLQPCIDRYLAFEEVFPTSWQSMAREVLDAPDDAARIALIETFLLRQPLMLPAIEPPLPLKISQWNGVVARRAMSLPAAVSDRHADRRIKLWTGQTLRQIHRVGRVENALLMASDRLGMQQASWADIAVECGFSDQAHLCREFRRVTNSSPQALRQMALQESHWLYRVWVL